MHYSIFSNIFYELFLNIFPKPFSHSYITYKIHITFILFIFLICDSSILSKAVSSFFIYPIMISFPCYVKKMYLNKWSPVMKIIDNNGHKIRFNVVCRFDPLEDSNVVINFNDFKKIMKKLVKSQRKHIIEVFHRGGDYHIKFGKNSANIDVSLLHPLHI